MRSAPDPWMGTWITLVRTYNRLWTQVEAAMHHDADLTMARYDVLAQLVNHGGRLGLSDLASALLLSPSGLSRLLDRMEASGLVRREPDPHDARASVAVITTSGATVEARARSKHHEFMQTAFGDRLNVRDLSDLRRVLAKLSAPPPAD